MNKLLDGQKTILFTVSNITDEKMNKFLFVYSFLKKPIKLNQRLESIESGLIEKSKFYQTSPKKPLIKIPIRHKNWSNGMFIMKIVYSLECMIIVINQSESSITYEMTPR